MKELNVIEMILPLIYTCFTLPSLYLLLRYYMLNRKKEFHSLLLLLALFSFFLLNQSGSRLFAYYTDLIYLATQLSRLQEASLLFLFILIPYVINTNYQLNARWRKINRFFFLIGIVICIYMMFFAFVKPEVFVDVMSLMKEDFRPGRILGKGATGYLLSLRDIIIVMYFIYGVVVVMANRRDHVLNPVQSSIIIGVVIIFISSIGDLVRNISGDYGIYSGFITFEFGITIFSLFVFSRTTLYILKRGILSESIQKSLEEKQRLLEHQATHRRETGLFNRDAFHDVIDRYFKEEKEGEGVDALIYVAIDNYTDLYESFGSEKTDQIIKQICFRIQNVLIDKSILFQTGSREFVIFIRDAESDEYVKRFTEILRSILLQRIPLSDNFYYINMRMGVLSLPDDASNLEEVQKNAYNTLNNVELSQNKIVHYNEGIGRKSSERFEVINLIQKTLNKRQFHNIYKVICDAEGKEIALEARIGWNHPYSPELLLSEAENSGIMTELGRYSLKLVLEDIRSLRINEIRKKVYVKFSYSQMSGEGFAREVLNKIEGANLTIDDLGFQIEEKPATSGQSFYAENIELLKTNGFDLILDDFGKNGHNIAKLHNLSLSFLKLSRSLLDNVENEERKMISLRHILSLLKDLDISVMADGVESAEVLKILKSENVALFMGDYFRKPMTLEELINR